jgi:hypothetical protein
MRLPTYLSAIIIGLLAPGLAWCEAMPAPVAEPASARTDPASLQPVASAADSQRIAAENGNIGVNLAAAYREHAPLALFSLGSLAIGGAFYAIGHGADGSRVAYSGDRSQFTAAVSVAGITALLAAGSYFYYVHRAKAAVAEDPEWDAAVIGAPDGAGGVAVGARLTLALPSLR